MLLMVTTPTSVGATSNQLRRPIDALIADEVSSQLLVLPGRVESRQDSLGFPQNLLILSVLICSLNMFGYVYLFEALGIA